MARLARRSRDVRWSPLRHFLAGWECAQFSRFSHDRHSSYWVFLSTPVGIALALFLPVHFWALGDALQLDAFLAWTEQPLVKFSEWHW